jgi:hypothetical protein
MAVDLIPARIAAVRAPRFLPEIVRNQMEEAAWAYKMRRQLLVQTDKPLFALERQETILRNHMAGLASAYTPKLERTFRKLIASPGKDTPEQAFVAAFLLLRCAREDNEAHVAYAFGAARCPHHTAALTDALSLAGINGPPAVQHLVDGLLHSDGVHVDALPHALAQATLSRAVRAQLQAYPWPSDARLVGMCLGVLPLDATWVAAQCVALAHTPSDALDALLAQLAPQLLNTLTRQAALSGKLPSARRVATLAALLPTQGAQYEHDWALLMTWLRDPEICDVILRALPLTGQPQAAEICLGYALAPEPSASCHHEARKSFEYFSGISIELPQAPQRQSVTATRALNDENLVALEAAAHTWRSRRSLSRLATPILMGRPRDLDALWEAKEHLTIADWQRWLELLATRSAGHIRLRHSLFVELQWAQLEQQRSHVDAALFESTKAVPTTAFAGALTACLSPASHRQPRTMNPGRL